MVEVKDQSQLTELPKAASPVSAEGVKEVEDPRVVLENFLDSLKGKDDEASNVAGYFTADVLRKVERTKQEWEDSGWVFGLFLGGSSALALVASYYGEQPRTVMIDILSVGVTFLSTIGGATIGERIGKGIGGWRADKSLANAVEIIS